MQTKLSVGGSPLQLRLVHISALFFYTHAPLIFTPQTLSRSQNSDYLLLRLTLRFGVIVEEVLFPLRGCEFTHIPNKHVLFVATAEPVRTEQEWKERKGICK